MGKWLVIAGLFSAVLLLQARGFRASNSIVYDETFYLSCAQQTLHDHAIDPRLAQYGVAPLPILLSYLLPLHGNGAERDHPWVGGAKDAEKIEGPRLASSILFGIPLILIVSGWLYYRKGVWAALTGAGLIALSPTILAHVSLATTDACLAVFVSGTLCLMSRYLQRPSRWKLFWLSIAIGAAIASKYSALFLLPVFGLLLLLRATAKTAEQNARSWRTQIAAFVAVPILIFVSCWALHGFGSVRLNRINLIGMPKDTFGVELFGQTPLAKKIDSLNVPSPIAGIAFQYLHNLQGHPAFLMGERSDHGWWYFLPCAFAFKSTPAELLLTAILIFTLAASIPRFIHALRSLDFDLQTLIVGAITFLLLIMMSRVNMAQRYLLPLYPLLIILGVDRIWHALGAKPKWQIGTIVAFIGLQLWSSVSIAPHYLSYFNRLSGGPEQSWHLLVDSNVDWGQDLPALRDKLTTLGNKRIALAYFGTARPRAYNINADSIFESTPSVKYDILAVSVTFLQGLYLKMPSTFQNFAAMKPLDKAGYSIFLFDVSTPQGEAAFADALKRIEAGSKADPQLAASKTDVDLYQFTMTLLAVQDYPDKDVFDVCYSQLFQDRSAAPAKLAFIQNKLDSIGGSGYRVDFKLGLLHAAKMILLPGAASASPNGLSRQDYEQFRNEYNLAVSLLSKAAEVGPPVADILKETGKRIDSDKDGLLSDQEIAAFLNKKGLTSGNRY